MKEEGKDNYKKAFSTVITIFGGTATTALTGDPFSGMVLGNFLTEMLSMQSKVKQDRVFKFFELLERDLKILTDNYDLSKIDKTTTWDLVELAMVKASRTNNEERIKRLKNIIKNQIIEPTEFDYVERFLNLAGSLSDIQVLVLGHFIDSQREINKVNTKIKNLKREYDKLIKEMNSGNDHFSIKGNNEVVDKGYYDTLIKTNLTFTEKYKSEIESLYNHREEILVEFNLGDFHFMTAELVSMGLLFNPNSGTFADNGGFVQNHPTGLAIKFIEYLKD